MVLTDDGYSFQTKHVRIWNMVVERSNWRVQNRFGSNFSGEWFAACLSGRFLLYRSLVKQRIRRHGRGCDLRPESHVEEPAVCQADENSSSGGATSCARKISARRTKKGCRKDDRTEKPRTTSWIWSSWKRKGEGIAAQWIGIDAHPTWQMFQDLTVVEVRLVTSPPK